MDYSSLRAFIAVVREGNLTRAAEQLCVTQPALSLQLKKFQEGLGVKLLERTSHGMRLTEAGHRLLPSAERAIRAASEFGAAASSLKGDVTGDLKLGTIVDPEFLRLGPFLQKISESHPLIRFDLTHGMSGTVQRWVESGKVDAAYTMDLTGTEKLSEKFEVIPLTQFTYRVIGPAAWAGQIKNKSWEHLAKLPWIKTPEDSIHSKLLRKIFESESGAPQIVAQVDLEPTMLEIVRSGIALSLSRDSIALRQFHSGSVSIADRVSIDAELAFICRKDRIQEPRIRIALDAVKRLW